MRPSNKAHNKGNILILPIEHKNNYSAKQVDEQPASQNKAKNPITHIFGPNTIAIGTAARLLNDTPYSKQEVLEILQELDAATNGTQTSGIISRQNLMDYAAKAKNTLLSSDTLIRLVKQYQLTQSIKALQDNRTATSSGESQLNKVVSIFGSKDMTLDKARDVIYQQQKRMDMLLALHQLFQQHSCNY